MYEKCSFFSPIINKNDWRANFLIKRFNASSFFACALVTLSRKSIWHDLTVLVCGLGKPRSRQILLQNGNKIVCMARRLLEIMIWTFLEFWRFPKVLKSETLLIAKMRAFILTFQIDFWKWMYWNGNDDI